MASRKPIKVKIKGDTTSPDLSDGDVWVRRLLAISKLVLAVASVVSAVALALK